MRILAIRGKNLASLEGEFEIDFTKDPLKSAGIFAITGSTGAGKSTILDTLCLALFDDTPRTNKAGENIYVADVSNKTINQRDSRTILRRGTSEGYAQVDFISLSGEKYRSTWSVKRAYSKINGSLQNSEVRLINLTDNTEFPGRKGEILHQISELIGLTFTQFTRAVLLAQGDFANFLKARQSEKAELLEKLTGTEIYSHISINIYEKSKLAEQSLSVIEEKIKDIPLLSEEEKETLQTEKKGIEEDLCGLQKTTQILYEKIKWIRTEVELIKEIEEAHKRLLSIEERIEDAKPRYEYIRKIDAAQEIRDIFQTFIQNKKQLKANQTTLERLETNLIEQEKQLATLKEAYLICEEEQNKLQEAYTKAEPDIIKARQLEIELVNTKANFEENKKESEKTYLLKNKKENSLVKLQQEIEQKEKQYQEVQIWLTKYKEYESIVERIDLIINLINDIKDTQAFISNGKTSLENTSSLLNSQLTRQNELQQEAQKLEKMLPKEVALLRGKLEEGIPCPVCGSLHHPLKGIITENSLNEKELEDAKLLLDKQLSLHSESVEKTKSEITRLQTLIESYTRQQTNATEKLDIYLKVLPSWKKYDPELLQGKIKNFVIQWNEKIQLFNLLQVDIKNLKIQLTSETEMCEEVRKIEIIQKEKLSRSQSLLSTLTEKRKLLFNGKAVEEIVGYYTNKKQFITIKIKQLEEEKTQKQSICESTKGRINQLKKDINNLNEYIEKQQLVIKEWLENKNGLYTHDFLTEIFSREIDWITREKEFLNGLQENRTVVTATLKERQTVLEKHLLSEYKPDPEEKEITILQQTVIEKENSIKEKQKRATEIEIIFTTHEKAKEQLKVYQREYEEQTEITENWKKLNELFGSATGNKFKEIAQGYTLDTLLKYANKHLFELSKRYTLERVADTLALQVVDMDMLGEVRAVHSLSGGETFLISLALALGLSSLSSNRMNIESLFIDEGFGSLDMETLSIAMDALDRLRTQGRKIGVISHVAEMTERITTQIRVIKLANGRSAIEVTNRA